MTRPFTIVAEGELIRSADPQEVADEVRKVLARFNSCTSKCRVDLRTTVMVAEHQTFTGRY